MTSVGKYQILEQVGEGAMGIVYKALDPVLNRTVAIKVMSEGMAHDESLRARFLREAQAAGSLQHPNVVTIYDFGETDGHLFIAMQFIQGADLEQLLYHEAPLSLAAKLDIIVDVLNGLSYAHRKGIVHRDIKPANIRVDEEGHARIMDFGVAHLATSNLTKSGVMMGTPNYMAPEQITGENLTPAVDLFSVGAVLYELLTLAKPFQGDTMHNVLFKIVTDTPTALRDLKPELPPALNDIVMKALAKNPTDRFRSAAEMANALSAVRAPLGPARLSKTVSQRISIDKGLLEQREALEKARRMRRRRAIGGGAAALLTIAALAFLIGRRNKPVSPPPTVPPATAVIAAGAATDTTKPQQPAAPLPQSTAPMTGQPVTKVAESKQTPTAPLSVPPTTPATRPDREAARRATLAAPRPAPAGQTKSVAKDDSVRVAASGSTQPALLTQGVTPPPPLPSQVVPQQPVAPPPAAAPASSTSTAKAVTAEPENPSAAIGSLISAYGRAIGTRDVAEVRRVYVGMTPQQQSQWESFFASVRSMSATFQVASLDVSGSTAVAHLTGVYEYVTRAGRTERQPVTFETTLQRDGDRWRLQAVR